ncbi:MAG: tRNA (adenosine(37)-N6)-threonylcarbamoyltransferase complex dimerization subunit type 1 TsaB [Chthoniobacterales bacterium]
MELSSPRGSIAFVEGGQEPFAISFANDRKDSRRFFEELQACLQRFGNPERIVVGLGPGSYAGTRIAIATASGLAAASGVSLAGVSSVLAMTTDSREYSVIGDARRQSYYFARVENRQCAEGPLLFSEEELRARLSSARAPIFATKRIEAFPQAEVAQPAADILAQLPMTVATGPLEPIYLRAPHITLPRK